MTGLSLIACATPVEKTTECYSGSIFQEGTDEENRLDAEACAESLRSLEGKQFYTTRISHDGYKLVSLPENKIPAIFDLEGMSDSVPFALYTHSSELFDIVADSLVFKDKETLDQYNATRGNIERYDFLVALSQESLDAILASEDGVLLQQFINDATVSQAWTIDEFEGAREALMSYTNILDDLSVLNENLQIEMPVDYLADKPLMSDSLEAIKYLSPEHQEFMISAKRRLDTLQCEPEFSPAEQAEYDWLVHVLDSFVGYHSMDQYLTRISRSE